MNERFAVKAVLCDIIMCWGSQTHISMEFTDTFQLKSTLTSDRKLCTSPHRNHIGSPRNSSQESLLVRRSLSSRCCHRWDESAPMHQGKKSPKNIDVKADSSTLRCQRIRSGGKCV